MHETGVSLNAGVFNNKPDKEYYYTQLYPDCNGHCMTL